MAVEEGYEILTPPEIRSMKRDIQDTVKELKAMKDVLERAINSLASKIEDFKNEVSKQQSITITLLTKMTELIIKVTDTITELQKLTKAIEIASESSSSNVFIEYYKKIANGIADLRMLEQELLEEMKRLREITEKVYLEIEDLKKTGKPMFFPPVPPFVPPPEEK